MNLVTFSDLKVLLGLSKNESDYPELTLIKNSVFNAFESYLLRTLTYGQKTEVLEPSRRVVLSALPIKSLLTVVQNGVSLPVTNYKIRPYGIEGNFSSDADVTITYNGGLETIPGPINRAALLQTAYEYQNRDHIGATVVNNEGGSVQVPALGLLPEVKRLLDPYKHPARGIL